MASSEKHSAAGKLDARRVLKMFSGPSMGAEIALDAGRYLVGRDISNDLILNDRMVAPVHLQIRIAADGVHVKPLAMPVYVDGKEIPARETPLRDYQVVTLGTTHFALGPVDATWPVIGLPRILQVTSSENLAAGESAEESSRMRRQGRVLLARHPWLKWLLAGWGLLVLLLLLSTFGGSGGSDDPAVTRERLEAVIADTGLDGRVTISRSSDGNFSISGYLDNEADRVRLERALAEQGIDVPVAIWNRYNLAESAQSILMAVGIRNVTVWPDRGRTPGELVVSGYYDDAANWKRALAMLREDIPGISSIDDHAVSSVDSRAQALRELVVAHGLEEKVKVRVVDGTLIVEGDLLTEEDQRKWEALSGEYRKRFLDDPQFFQKARKEKKKLYIPLRSISIGDDISYIVTRDGRKYTEGAYIGEGFVLQRILSDRLLLERDGNTIEYRLEE